jgi:peptide/nickel transport system ATP-binding protein
MLELTKLSVSFSRYTGLFRQERITRLSDIDLNVAQGEIVALIGHSGAGKSILAHAILGLLPPNAMVEGSVYFQSSLLTEPVLMKKRGREIAFLPQQTTYLDPTADTGSLISWAARRAGKTPQIKARLEQVGLSSEVASLYPHQLSGGMARRILMAQATAGGPALLIADEPTAGLDPLNCDTILQQLRKQADNGGAVLLITHDLVSVFPYADRIAILNEGKICCVAPVSAFSGAGEKLNSRYAQSMWRALPQNGFNAYA